ncbi:DNA internalization-related competence protein ComEC/Rec2 [Alkalibacillus aidingensis]|uniref:DNA internalization-related competence protein ComEC/Rec2 n=1 Tax=Alkalibacillus aidingensis TaxID=2747607 RepID=UPI001CB74D20|nr:DNA internalization-related competence protein ComEC/Rec2 [Alkalibacillus aidingensis]
MRGHWYTIVICYLAGYLPTVISIILFMIILLIFLTFNSINRLLLVISLFAFILSFFISPKVTELTMVEDSQAFSGQVKVTSVETSNNDYQYIFKIKGSQYFLQARFDRLSHDEIYPLKHGMVCSMSGELTRPMDPRNPGQFDYPGFLKKQGIIGIMFEPEISDCNGRSLLSYPLEVRGLLFDSLTSQYREETITWINALIFGDRSLLDDQIIETFQYWNISHLLAISGLHVAFFLGFLYGIFHYVLRLSKDHSKWLMLIIIPFYVLIAGSNPPVVRAGMMAFILVIISKFHRKWDTTDVISLVCLILLITNPYLLYQLSFQFSFLVTVAIVLSKRIIQDGNWLMISLRISLISQLVILPLQFIYFHFTNVFSFLVNLLFIPYYTCFVIPYCLILLLTSWFPNSFNRVLEDLFLVIQNFTHELLINIGEPSLSTWVVGTPHIISILLFYALFVAMMRYWDQQKLNKAAILGTMALSVFLIEQLIPHLDDTYSITMLDVGQAESIIIELPNRTGVFIVDVGEEVSHWTDEERNNNYHHVIKPYLWSQGISQIDGVFISHFDHDHVGSAPLLVDDFNPQYIFTHPYVTESSYLESIANKKLQPLFEGVSFEIGKAKFTVVSPELIKEPIQDENQLSVVFILDVQGHRTLFTGDIDQSVEEGLLVFESLQEVDLLKVAHHGSQTSSSEEFLSEIAPQHGLISVGRNNMYKHPNEEVVDRLLKQGIELWRTDQNGAIKVEIRKGQSTIKPFLP